MSFVIFHKVTKKFVSLQTFATKFLMKKILITGASGFIGSFIVEEALRRGMETWAVVRRTSSREYLQDERIEQQPYKEIEPTDTPQPNTAYGKSKLEAEQLLPSSFPYIILRPTGVYGPREKDYFLMAKSIKGHSDFAVGYKQQDITFVYVKDVVQATFLALEHGKIGSAYFLSDGKVYQSTTFSDLIHEELGRPWWIRITAPIWVLRVVTFFGDLIGHATGKISALNNDKYQILKQRNWRCNIRPAIEELGYKPEYELKRGVKETIEWYKKEGWL